ncbi:MAG: hypothetical protein Q8S26_19015 [Azonexus sp.]|nr:hypothetical protein [Azonexus sp.]
MAYRHDWLPNGAHIKFWGETSGDEIDEAIEHIRNSPDLAKLAYVIADYLGVTEFHVTRYQILLVAAHDHWMGDANANLKIALVGCQARILEAFRHYSESAVIKETFVVRTFTNLEDASHWASGQQ